MSFTLIRNNKSYTVSCIRQEIDRVENTLLCVYQYSVDTPTGAKQEQMTKIFSLEDLQSAGVQLSRLNLDDIAQTLAVAEWGD